MVASCSVAGASPCQGGCHCSHRCVCGATEHWTWTSSFFQALSIATKISRGTIEILSEVHLIKKDEKVGFSEAALLKMLNIFPFSYGVRVTEGMLMKE